jgi:hypothetical protein
MSRLRFAARDSNNVVGMMMHGVGSMSGQEARETRARVARILAIRTASCQRKSVHIGVCHVNNYRNVDYRARHEQKMKGAV